MSIDRERRAAWFLMIALLAYAPVSAEAIHSALPVTCGLDGSDEEKIQDCREKLGSESELCLLTVSQTLVRRVYRIRCQPDLTQWTQDGVGAERLALKTRAVVPQEETPLIPFRAGEAWISVETYPHSTQPVHASSSVPLGDCGLSGTLEERASDCSVQARREGRLSRFCWVVDAQSEGPIFSVSCERQGLYRWIGLSVQEWLMISQYERRPIWAHLTESMLYSNVHPSEAIGPIKALGLGFHSGGGTWGRGACADKKEILKGKLGLSELAFDLVGCRTARESLRLGLATLDAFHASPGASSWCRSEGDDGPSRSDGPISIALIGEGDRFRPPVSTESANPLASLHSLCVSRIPTTTLKNLERLE